jgi:predicted negative regulator of RcsB-dependent stress response
MANRHKFTRFSLKWLLFVPVLVAAFVAGWQHRIETRRSEYQSAVAQVERVRRSLHEQSREQQRQREIDSRIRMNQLQRDLSRAHIDHRMKLLQNHPLNR